MTLTPANARRIAVARLQRQHLADKPTLTSAADVVRALCAVQSQDYAGAKWAIGMRATGLTDAAIDRAYDAGEIVRTHVLRPTWHFVAPEDLLWMQRLTGPRITAKMAPYNKTLGLTPAVFRKGSKVIEKALTGHRYLTRQQLKMALDRAKIATEGSQRLAHLVMQAEVEGLICSGPRAGTQVTYALVSDRVPHSRDLTGDEALLELTQRYFATHAPATVHDFAWWSGLSIAECRRGIALAGNELETRRIDDISYHVPPGFELPREASTAVHLLPNYDEFFIGFRDRSAIGQRLEDIKLVTGGNALIAHVVTIGGQLVGGWKRAVKQKTASVDLKLLAPLNGAEQKRLTARIRQFERFVETSD